MQRVWWPHTDLVPCKPVVLQRRAFDLPVEAAVIFNLAQRSRKLPALVILPLGEHCEGAVILHELVGAWRQPCSTAAELLLGRNTVAILHTPTDSHTDTLQHHIHQPWTRSHFSEAIHAEQNLAQLCFELSRICSDLERYSTTFEVLQAPAFGPVCMD